MQTSVTCLCLTRNRREWLPRAIACFLAQTYEHRDLLIIADGDDVSDIVPANDPRIRLVLSDKLSIGAKRNFGVLLAQGDVVATWDDDDHSRPERIGHQISLLSEARKSVTGYRRMRFVNRIGQWVLYEGSPDYAVGTSLTFSREWALANPYPDKQVHEDCDFWRNALAQGRFVGSDELDMMHATSHPGNTSPRIVVGGNWKLCEPPPYGIEAV